MSIIQQALKKAEKESKQKRNSPPAKDLAELSIDQKSFSGQYDKAPKNYNPVWASIIIIAIVSISAYFIAGFFKSAAPLPVSKAPETPSSNAPESSPLPEDKNIPAEKILAEPDEENVPTGTLQKEPMPPEIATAQPSAADDISNVVLSGIMYSSRLPYAVINDSLRKEGDMIDGAKIVKIRQKTVEIEKNGRVFTLKLQE